MWVFCEKPKEKHKQAASIIYLEKILCKDTSVAFIFKFNLLHQFHEETHILFF